MSARRNLTTAVLTALVFSVVLAFATPSRGDDLSAAVQKTFDAFCGLNLRYIEACSMRREQCVASPAIVAA